MIWLLACSSPKPLEPWPEEPAALVQACDEERIEALAITCRVQAASVLGREGRGAEGEEQCSKLSTGVWADECRFRLGEELAASGKLVEGLGQCVQAGQFARNCITHAVWRAPGSLLDLEQGLPAIEADFKEALMAADSVLARAPRDTRNEAMAAVAAKIGFAAYVGTGRADPGPAKLGRELGVSLRTGYAVEAARLMALKGGFSPGAVQQAWTSGTVIEGEPDVSAGRKGRYREPRISPMEEGLARAFSFGGGSRLVGADPEEDIAIASLEAAFWLEQWPAEGFTGYLGASSARVRCTAAGLLAASGGTEGLAVPEGQHDCVEWHLRGILPNNEGGTETNPVKKDIPSSAR